MGLRTPEITAPFFKKIYCMSLANKDLCIATPGLGKTFPMNGTYGSGLHIQVSQECEAHNLNLGLS